MILVCGTVCIDRVRRVTHLPKLGGYVSVQSEELRLGGEAANTAFALQSWGAEFQLVGNHSGRRGDSEDWNRLWALLDGTGLSKYVAEPQRHGSAGVPICDIYITPGGQRTMFGLGFDQLANGLKAADFDLSHVSWFTIDMNLGQLGRDLVVRANDQGVQTYLLDFVHEADPIPKGCIWQSSTDWVGKSGDRDANAKVAQNICDRFGATAIVTDGEFGTVYAQPGEAIKFCQPYKAGSVVDSTGAGDTFRAAMLRQLFNQVPMDDAVRWASVAASLKCQYHGATTVQPTIAEIKAGFADY
ncbi:MAG: carbohydrate kinase family protein [Fimbriimonadaceae bacterium]